MSSQNTSLQILQNHLAQTGGKALSLRERKALQHAAQQRTVVLMDISGSMGEQITPGVRSIDALWTVVQDLRASGQQFRLAAFSTYCEWYDRAETPQPSSSTGLAEALDWLRQNAPGMQQVIIITDGMPDSQSDTLRAASDLGCLIQVIYIGPDNIYAIPAIEFCKKLAQQFGGQFSKQSLFTEALQLEMSTKIAGLLAMPEGKGQINL